MASRAPEAQARALDDYLAARGEKVDLALHITAPSDILEMRMGARMVCPVCHAIYNTLTKLPKNDLRCDTDGTPLERRSDEQTETIRMRLETHRRQTEPLIEYYRQRGSLAEIDGSRTPDEVQRQVDSHLELPATR